MLCDTQGSDSSGDEGSDLLGCVTLCSPPIQSSWRLRHTKCYWENFLPPNLDFPLSVSFHQFTILTHLSSITHYLINCERLETIHLIIRDKQNCVSCFSVSGVDSLARAYGASYIEAGWTRKKAYGQKQKTTSFRPGIQSSPCSPQPLALPTEASYISWQSAQDVSYKIEADTVRRHSQTL